jgi:hypothetical protein
MMIELPAWDTIGLRLLGIACGLVAWFVTQRMIGQRHLEGGGIYDHLHRLTAAGNAWLHVHPGAARAALIASSLGVDAVSLFVLGYAVVGPSFSPFWGLLCLFGLRQASQAVVALPAPSGIIWRDPGFPSLFVTYAVGNDFFFRVTPRWPFMAPSRSPLSAFPSSLLSRPCWRCCRCWW